MLGDRCGTGKGRRRRGAGVAGSRSRSGASPRSARQTSARSTSGLFPPAPEGTGGSLRPPTPSGPRPAPESKLTTGSVWAVGGGHLVVTKWGADSVAASVHDEHGHAEEVVILTAETIERMRRYLACVESVLALPPAP